MRENFYRETQALQVELLRKVAPYLSDEKLAHASAIETTFNERMRTALGRAHYEKNRIELNLRVLEKHPEELAPTFAHEFAHLVAPLIYGRRGLGHQIGWRKVMELFGYPPERTHDLEIADLRRRHRVVAYAECACPDFLHEVKVLRYRKMQRGRRYICLKCRSQLRLRK